MAEDIDKALMRLSEETRTVILTEILERRLPQYPASIALKRRLAAR